MSSDIDELLEQLDTPEPDPVPVYVGEPFSTGWVYVPYELSKKIAAIIQAEEVEKP